MTKRIDLDCHFIHEMVKVGIIKTMHVGLWCQLADALAKASQPRHFKSLIGTMGVQDLFSILRGSIKMVEGTEDQD